MKKHLLLMAVTTTLFLTSCTKQINFETSNTIVGTWQLLYTERQDNYGTSTQYTGYEQGFFQFYGTGQAIYDDGFEVMKGTWKTSQVSNGYYDSHGNYHGGVYQIFDIYLSNYSGTRVIDWQFDESWFNNSNRFSAMYYVTNYDYKYVFGRR